MSEHIKAQANGVSAPTSPMPDSPASMLEAAYRELDYAHGAGLYGAVDGNRPRGNSPGGSSTDISLEDWLDKGEWLSLASEVGAQQIFFVGNNPVVVFAQHTQEGGGTDEEALRRMFNRIWCMGRPRLLFLAREGELSVYDLAQKPASRNQDLNEGRLLETARGVVEVSERLAAFRRERVESGQIFEDKDKLKAPRNRADESLIRHLKVVRRRLTGGAPGSEKGVRALKVEHAHALIGRSIFVRYLEDRRILVKDDFYEVAAERPEWRALLDQPWEKPLFDAEDADRLYLKVLRDKEFTYSPSWTRNGRASSAAWSTALTGLFPPDRSTCATSGSICARSAAREAALKYLEAPPST